MTASKVQMVWRGVRRRCPRCGGRGWFRGLFTRGERCVACGYTPDRQVGFVLGAITVNMVVTLMLVGAALAIGIIATWPDIAPVPIMAVCLAIAVVTPVIGYSCSHTVWAAVDLAMRPLEPHEEADAAAWLASRGDSEPSP